MVMLGIFYCQLIVHSELIPEGKTVNNEVYMAILPRLRGVQNEKL
jgi:hypothetical protein